jgi:hypothetical protein
MGRLHFLHIALPALSPLALVGGGVLVCTLFAACSGGDDGDSVVDLTVEQVGTCVDFPPDTGPDITSLPAVLCDVEHSHEIFAVIDYQAADPESGGDLYPGSDELERFSQAECLTLFEPYVGVGAFDSSLFYSWIVPTLTSWDKSDDRQVICVVGNQNGAPLFSSVKESAR